MMHPRLLATSIAVVIWGCGSAEAQTLVLGGRAGLTSATQWLNQPYFGYQRVHGTTAGVAATLELGPYFAVQAEGLYVEKGARYYTSYQMRMSYLEGSLLARLSWPIASSRYRLFALGGMAPSVELRCAGYQTVNNPVVNFFDAPPGTSPLDCDSQRQRHTDRSQVMGGGLAFDRGPSQVTLEFRRTRGSDIAGYDCCQLRNDVTSFLLGVSRKLR